MMIDPWSSQQYEYEKLFDTFGIERFTETFWKDLPNAPFFFRRGIVFGHRGFQKIQHQIAHNSSWAILTGLMPSGKMHLGHKIVIDQVIYYQSIGADITIAVADIEAFATRGYSIQTASDLAFEEYILNYIALGLKPCRIYFQSKNELVKDLGYFLAKKANLSQVNAIYGFTGTTNMAHVFAPFVQTGDILHVQLDPYGSARPTLVPVGADQDPHIRFCRDIADSHRLYSIIPQTESDTVGVFVKGDSECISELLDRAVDVVTNQGGVIVERKDDYKALYVRIDDQTQFDIALAQIERQYDGYGFIAPSSTYHRFISGLDGNKMSSSRPSYAIFLTDTSEEIKEKLWSAKTGGKQSADEQRRQGGNPDACIIYELFMYGLILNDDELVKLYNQCKGGELLCGQCKKHAYELLTKFLKDLAEKRERARDMLDDYLIEGKN